MRFKEYKEGGKTSEDKKIYAYNYYLKKGVPAVQAAGIVGNLAAESGFNTTVVGKADSKQSQGIGQWHSERLNGLKKFAGNNWTTLDSQLDYVLHELNTTEKKAKVSLFAAKTPQEAAIVFMNDYERPAEWAKKQSGNKRVNESLKLLGLTPDPNYSYGSENYNPYRFDEYKRTDFYEPQVIENVSSLDNKQENTNLAEDKATEIKNRLEQKKAEKDLLQQMILATQVAYVNPADYQSQPTFEEPEQEQIFQAGGISQFKKQPFKLKDERGRVATENTRVNNYNNTRLFNPNVRNKTDKEVAKEREAKIVASTEAQKIPYTKENWRRQLAKETEATGDKLRVSLEPNFFDDYLNPAVMVGNMASSLGQAPLQAEQSDSILPYVTSVGTPLVAGALAGLGTQSTGQFVNNLANPLAGTGDLVNNLGNKYLPNAYKLNPRAFKPKSDAYYRQVFSKKEVENPLITKSMQKNNDLKGITAYINSSEENFLDGSTNTPFELLKLPTTESLPYFNKGKPYYTENYTKFKNDELLIESNKSFKDYEDFNPAATNYMSDKPEQIEQALKMSGDIRVLNPFSKEGFDLNNYNKYKKDWLQGYKRVELTSGSNPLIPTYKIIEQEEEFKNGGEKNSLWKNIRANRGSGRRPTREMLEQERKIERKEDVGVIPVSSLGVYQYPNEEVIVPTDGLITMKSVPYDILGISQETGQQILMKPEKEYFFPNTQNVLEIPQIKSRIKTNRFSK